MIDDETHEGIVARLERERNMERERAARAEKKLELAAGLIIRARDAIESAPLSGDLADYVDKHIRR